MDSLHRLIHKEMGEAEHVRVLEGGDTRQESVAKCIAVISAPCDLVAIHDGARPLLTQQLLLDILNKADETGAAIAAVPCKDTVKLCSEEGVVSETLDRSKVWLVQTPQCFHYELVRSAYEEAGRHNRTATDDAALVEMTGARVHVVPGSYENIKITTPEDIPLCEEILKQRMRLCGLE
jgi:2-C-methyl-D-erythritol 4-phosphate cytidylyltransferase